MSKKNYPSRAAVVEHVYPPAAQLNNVKDEADYGEMQVFEELREEHFKTGHIPGDTYVTVRM